MPVWPFYTRACPMGQSHTAMANIELAALVDARPETEDDLKLRLHVPAAVRARADELLRDAGIGDQRVPIGASGDAHQHGVG